MKFKLFGRLRDDDESSTGNQGLSGGSLERTVENMFQQGYSEEEIKEELEGRYSEQEISQAVNNTVTSSATDDGGPQAMTAYNSGSDEAVSPMDEGYDGDSEADSQPEGMESMEGMNQDQQNQPQGQQQQMQQEQMGQNQMNQEPIPQQGQPQGQQGLDNYQDQNIDPAMEELIETIVAEKFNQVESEFSKIYEEMDIMIDELESLEDRVHDLEVRDDEDQQEFVQKVDEMEDHIDSYQSRIGGLEKAFQQVLPSLVENVKDLTSLVQEIKDDKGIETSTTVDQEDVEDIDMSDW
ncbi:MAG: hypothetical protein R6V35_03115 [Candidatus Nanohaloarchaea archaeon]